MAKNEITEEEKIDKQILDLLMKKGIKTAPEISKALNQMYGKVVQRLLDEEFNEFMEYEKGSHENKKDNNRRNGATSKGKKVKTDNGEITIVPPRDREGKFEPKIVKKRQKVLEGFDNLVISMYAKGNTLKDIKETIREIYIDCLYCSVKEDLRSIKKAIYVVLGVDTEGKKEVLGIWIDTTESASKWCEIFEELKLRGVEDIFFVSMDGLTGLPEAIESVYPQTITQRCIVHIVRNIYSILDKKKAKDVIADFMQIYTGSNINFAKLAYENFLQKYKENTKLIKKVNDLIHHVFSIFDYPIEIRKVMYTTNPIESLNSCLRKVTRGKGAFPSENSVFKVLFLRIQELTEKWSRPIQNWKTIQAQLIEIFGDRYTKYLTV